MCRPYTRFWVKQNFICKEQIMLTCVNVFIPFFAVVLFLVSVERHRLVICSMSYVIVLLYINNNFTHTHTTWYKHIILKILDRHLCVWGMSVSWKFLALGTKKRNTLCSYVLRMWPNCILYLCYRIWLSIFVLEL